MVRAKLTVQSITEHYYDKDGRTIKFACVYDPEGVKEDISFSKATPSGTLEFYVTNPKAIEQFRMGKTFYVDFREVES